MLRITGRHKREMLYGPTNEEMIVDIFRHAVKSYRELPKLLYHIQWKFRDEVRPRFDVMRGREFLMKDTYSFDLDQAGARRSYNKMFVAYLRTFARMGLKAIPVAADTGPIGGDLSHEFIILADTGESEVHCHRGLIERDVLKDDVDYQADLQPAVDSWTALYAASDEKHDAAKFSALPEAERMSARGIEVGHIFYFGTKYSKPMNCTVAGTDGNPIVVEMGSYGIGVSRLVGAIIEASHDDAGIVWPESVAPYHVGLIDLKPDDAQSRNVSEQIYRELIRAGVDVLFDDTPERAGAKFAAMDLIGLPWQAIVGPRGAKAGQVEIKERRTGKREELTIAAALNRFRQGR
jgi:prolyl-tRNA synthetase